MPVVANASDRILQEATRLFAARGFDGVSLQEIADAVGITKQSLLYHYPSKDVLRRSVLEHMLERWGDVLPKLLRAATAGQGQFDAVAKETVDFFAADPDRARLLVREVLDRPEEMAELIATRVRPWTALVCGTIRRGQAEGRLHADVDPEAYVACAINLILGTLATSRCLGALAPEGKSADEMLARHIQEVLRVAKTSLFLPEVR